MFLRPLCLAAVCTMTAACSMTFNLRPGLEVAHNKSSFHTLGEGFSAPGKTVAFAADPKSSTEAGYEVYPSGPHKIHFYGEQWLAHLACALNNVLSDAGAFDGRFDAGRSELCACNISTAQPTLDSWAEHQSAAKEASCSSDPAVGGTADVLYPHQGGIPASEANVVALKLVEATGQGVFAGIELKIAVEATVGDWSKTYKLEESSNMPDKEIFAKLGNALLQDQELWASIP